ncbi:hypothetical protein ACFY2R_00190 [Micromonospora olivasterospora]|uniref:Uncharacterized protein n=1 Tax=Micromonospora olivasterospora TaxID=1880 RepID=A0A562I9H6_MICOL|nr:hypothetical protein [Micromonospora olivasterospora]TWH67690.1 hypothetical protein JD77_02670 [Micromonospora olivasterospora]
MTDDQRRHMLLRLCEDDGVVRAGGMHHGTDYPCTGSAHFAGAHLFCTNPMHNSYGLSRADLLAKPGWPCSAVQRR